MEITKREILFSIIILAGMLIVGFFINSAIEENNTKNNEVYYLATKIEDENQFQYGLKTSIGNTLTYGEVSATTPVSMEEISGEYFYIEKVTEEYNRHTRIVTYTDSKGKTQTKTEVYYSWDYEKSESKQSDGFYFMSMSFKNNIVGLPCVRANLSEVAVEKDYVRSNYIYNNGFFESVGDTREYYNVVPVSFVGTFEARLYDNALENFSGGECLTFHNDKTIAETIEDIESSSDFSVIAFRIVWGILTIGAIVGFCYVDNRWLE